MAMTQKEQFNVRLAGELREKLEQYAKVTGRSKSFVATDALETYLAWRLPQIKDLQEAIEAADRGEFASEREAKALFSQHGV